MVLVTESKLSNLQMIQQSKRFTDLHFHFFRKSKKFICQKVWKNWKKVGVLLQKNWTKLSFHSQMIISSWKEANFIRKKWCEKRWIWQPCICMSWHQRNLHSIKYQNIITALYIIAQICKKLKFLFLGFSLLFISNFNLKRRLYQ